MACGRHSCLRFREAVLAGANMFALTILFLTPFAKHEYIQRVITRHSLQPCVVLLVENCCDGFWPGGLAEGSVSMAAREEAEPLGISEDFAKHQRTRMPAACSFVCPLLMTYTKYGRLIKIQAPLEEGV